MSQTGTLSCYATMFPPILLLPHQGDVYEGAYENEKKHGKGMYTSANGDVYEVSKWN